MQPPDATAPWRRVASIGVRIALVAAAYYLTARFCIELPVRDAPFTPVWIPSGIALVAVLMWGRWMAAGAFLGELAATTIVGGYPTGLPFFLAFGNGLEPLVAVAILDRAGFDRMFSRVRDVTWFVVACVAGAVVSSTIATVMLGVLGPTPWSDLPRQFVLFWESVVLGHFVIAPVLLALLQVDLRRRPSGARVGEALAITGLLLFVCSLIFLDESWQLVFLFLLFPLLTWATARFGIRGASLSVLLLTSVAVWATVHERVAIEGQTATQSTEVLSGILGIVAVSNLLLAALLNELEAARRRATRVASALDEAQEVAHVGSWEWDVVDGGGMIWSDEFERLIGFDPSAEPTEFETLLSHTHPDDRAQLDRSVRDAVAAQGAFRMEHRVIVGDDDHERIIEQVGRVVTDESGEVVRVIGTALDVTERRAVDRLRDELVATASHELRTPLTSIVGFASTLSLEWDRFEDTERRHFVEIIEQQGARLAALVEDTLTQSRIDAGTIPALGQPYDVSPVIERALSMLDWPHPPNVECATGLVATGNPDHLEQVLTNLLANARKYGEPPYWITAVSAEPGWIEVRVSDHGPGVADEFVPRMFDRFTRGPGSEMRTGTGLGLSIVRGLVEASGGTVAYERASQRTSFVLRLPEWVAPLR